MAQSACPACNTGNRIGDGDARLAKCGRCGERLFSGNLVEVNDETLSAHLKLNSGPVLLDVWAPWCGPCRMLAPALTAAAERFEPRLRLLKINTDENKAPAQLGVRAIPTLILFLQGREIARHAGLMTTEQLAAWISDALASISNMETPQ